MELKVLCMEYPGAYPRRYWLSLSKTVMSHILIHASKIWPKPDKSGRINGLFCGRIMLDLWRLTLSCSPPFQLWIDLHEVPGYSQWSSVHEVPVSPDTMMLVSEKSSCFSMECAKQKYHYCQILNRHTFCNVWRELVYFCGVTSCSEPQGAIQL